MARRLPLPTLLSFALMAFTIEFDNEAEHRLPHRTSDFGGSASEAWLVSLAMYFNCLQFVAEPGITMRALEREARTQPNWDGMRRWGYIFFAPDPNDVRPRPPESEWLVRTTAKGQIAREAMREVLPEIELRWRDRFGADTLATLRRSLIAMLRTIPGGLPDCMPILRFGLVCRGPKAREERPSEGELAGLALPILLARVLLAFALEYEEDSPLSLAICADLLRVLEPEGTLAYRIPALAGISKAALAMGLGFLEKRGYIQLVSQKPVQVGRLVLLTPSGVQAQADYEQRLRMLEERWKGRIGTKAMSELRTALETMGGNGTREGCPLFQGLEPYPRAGAPG